VNRVLAAEGKPAPNYKRVFRIMKRHGLLLQRHTGRRKGRLHDGKVVVMRSNLRWCSDIFEITCWNGEIVRIVFVIDAHDREVLAWHAVAGAGVSGSMLRDLMLESGGTAFRHDPGAIRRRVASPPKRRSTSLPPSAWCHASPRCTARSQTAAEAFVKTFKRDYARIHPLPDAATVL
jgi:putative transposase